MVNSPFSHNSHRAGFALLGRYAQTMALKPTGLQGMESDGAVWAGLLPSPSSYGSPLDRPTNREPNCWHEEKRRYWEGQQTEQMVGSSQRTIFPTLAFRLVLH